MSGVLIAILVLVGVFLVASIVFSRMTREVGDAPDDEYVELEGAWIRYRVRGAGPPVLLVHGWLSSSRIWEPLADRLAGRFTVYSLDLQGFGESDKPFSGYGIRYGSRLLYAFCAHFGLTKAAVVGHDVGGAMAVKLAADHQDVVGRLVLVSTPADEDQMDLPTLLWLATLPVVGPVVYALGRFVKPLRRLWMRPFVLEPDDLSEEVVEDAGRSTPAAVQKTFNVTRRELSRGRLVRQAGIIKVPVLVVAGEEDQIVDPQATGDWSRTIAAEPVLLDGCGHLPMLERPGEFDAQILAFLTGDPRHLDALTEEIEDYPPEEHEEPLARPEPGVSPTVIRKENGRYPPRDRSKDPEPSGEGPYDPDATGPPPDRYRSANENGGEEPPRGRSAERAEEPERAEERGRAEADGSAPGAPEDLSELPKDLFQWPDSIEKTRPWDRSREQDEGAEDSGEEKHP